MLKRFLSSLLLILFVVALIVCGIFCEEEEVEIAELHWEKYTPVSDYYCEVDETEEDIYKTIETEYLSKFEELEYTDDKLGWFKEYKEFELLYSEYIDPSESIYDYFTDEEIYLIQRVVETECFDKDFVSKVNVANVVLNRFESGLFGDSIAEIVKSPKQFCYGRKNVTEDTCLAVEYAFSIEDTTNGCIGFRSDKCPQTWNKWKYEFSDDAVHHFYKLEETYD